MPVDQGGDCVWRGLTELRMALCDRGIEDLFWLAGLLWLGGLVRTWWEKKEIQPALYWWILLSHVLAVVFLAFTVYVRAPLLAGARAHRYSHVSALLVILAFALTVMVAIRVQKGRLRGGRPCGFLP